MMFRQIRLVLAVLALIGTANVRAQGVDHVSEPARTSTVGVVSESRDPTSIRIVNDLAAALTDETLHIRPIVGTSPAQNVNALIKVKGADVGVAPSDILPYLRRDPRLAKPIQGLRYIAKLYDEEVHVLAGRDILSLAGLAGQRVNLGPRDSRAHITGSVLFRSLNIDVEALFLDEPVALGQLLRGEIAALVHVTRKPARLFFDLNRGDGVHFLPIPLSAELSQIYSSARLGIEDYPLLIGAGEAGRGAPISTVAVPMVLAVYNRGPGTDRYRALVLFTNALFRRAPALRGSSLGPTWDEFDLTANVPGWLRFAANEPQLKTAPGATAQHKPKDPGSKNALSQPVPRQPQQAERPPPTQETLEDFLRSGEGH